jgi:HK97 gp10 family phage protein
VTVDLKDVEAFLGDLDGEKRDVAVRAARMLDKHSEKVGRTARDLAPVDSGRLKRRINRRWASPLEVSVGTDYWKGHLVHDGTPTTPPRPFLAEAAAMHDARIGADDPGPRL